jgi:hypothetical protein
MRGLAQEALAHECGMGRTYLSSVQRSERNVSIDNIGASREDCASNHGSCSGMTEPAGVRTARWPAQYLSKGSRRPSAVASININAGAARSPAPPALGGHQIRPMPLARRPLFDPCPSG